MTSVRQIEANRRNALKSTGPKTEAGKQASRCNAVRHGLKAETVIGASEDAEDYKSFEAAITADYDAQSAVERELVLRLASLLWRLRRATPSRLACLRSRRTTSVILEGRTKSALPRVRSVIHFSMQTRIGKPRRTVSRTQPRPSRLQDWLQPKARLLRMLSSHVVSCGSAICPIMSSTASTAMKQPFGAKLAKSSMRWMRWIAANHRSENIVSIFIVSCVNKPAPIISRASASTSSDKTGSEGGETQAVAKRVARRTRTALRGLRASAGLSVCAVVP
jgi:hypothetical protein